MALIRMSFANHNILDIALSVIPPTVVQVRKNLGTSVNKFGQTEAAYSEWIEVYGIVQPGGEQNEHTNGVDFSRKHVTIWLRGFALDGTHLQWVPDQIRYVGGIFNVVGVKDWFPYDNYKECDCVEAMNLAPNQRGVDPQTSRMQRTTPRRKTRTNKATTDSNQQMLSFDAPQAVVPVAEEPLRKPTIFTAESQPKKQQSPLPKEEPPQKTVLVGKARIKF